MDQAENQITPSPQNLPERPSFWYLLKNPPTYHKPLVTLVAVTFFLSALGTIVYFTTIGKGQISFFPPQPATQQSIAPTSTLPTPTSDPTAGWKRYTDEVNNLQMNYPEGWVIMTAGSEKSPEETLQAWVERRERTSMLKPQIYRKTEVKVNGKKIIVEELSNSLYGRFLAATLLKDEVSVISIQFIPLPKKESSQPFSEEELKVFDQILSTFRFTD